MKNICLFITIALLVAAPILLTAAENGAALYESKCGMCHGAKGEGNSAAQMPAVNNTKMTVEQLVAYLTKGDKTKTIHADPISDLNADQAKAIAEFVKNLKK